MMKKTPLLVAAAVVAALAAGMLYKNGSTAADDVADDSVRAADATAPDPEEAARGLYVARAADCAACHTAPGSRSAYAGGYGLDTPFGTIYSSNITPDRDTGIGNWTEREFFRAVRHGRGTHGPLYPAMPYNAYVRLTDQDMHALWAYMRTVKPVRNHVDADTLPFPYNLRWSLIGWNLLFFDNSGFQAKPGESSAQTRGRYLVEGPGHCASCHTAKNALGGDTHAYLQGGELQGWFAPDITAQERTGLGRWSVEAIADYLHQGFNTQAVASGPMAEAVEHSTQYLSRDDLLAIGSYLKSVPAGKTGAISEHSPESLVMDRGSRLFQNNCVACHGWKGQGVTGMVSAFASSPALQSDNPASLIHTMLTGGRAAVTESSPTGAGMPAFAWKLDDTEVADVLTYIRNSWGNAATAVTPDMVTKARRSLKAPQAYPTNGH
ncbi:c-type cytochrome [Frateuria aurantia]